MYILCNMTTVMSIRTDTKVKADAQALASKIGIPLGTIVNAYLRKFIRDGGVSFNTDERMTPQMERIVAQAEKEIKNGETIGPFDSIEEMFAVLDATDGDDSVD
jgi:addiction module RelB/DinJ family antitoxin